MIGKLTPQQIEDLLFQHVVARIGCHADNVTYVVPTSYAYDGQYVYCHSEEGKKIEMMRKNPDVCFEVDSLDNMANWKSIIAWGRFEEITDPLERKEAIRILNNRVLPMATGQTVHLSDIWPFTNGGNEVNGVVYKILLDKKSGRYEEDASSPNIAG